MQALYSLILASGTKEAFFAALWLALDEEPGTFADVDFATLRATAARFGVALSESQIRKRVKELEKLDVLAVVPRRERGRFDLLVFQPAPNRFAEPESPKPEPATPLFDAAFGRGVESFAKPNVAPKPTVPVFATVSETETRTEAEAVAALETVESIRDRSRLTPFRCVELERVQTPEFTTCSVSKFAAETSENRVETSNRFAIDRAPESSEPFAAPLEEINNDKYIKNKTINKPAKDFETLDEDVGDQRERNRVRAIPERPAAPRDGSRAVAVARSVADVRSLVDFASPKVAAFRRLVARNVWERTIHPDLIDRIVALAVLRVGGTDAKAVESMIRDAKAEVALWNRTDGRRGQPQIWRAITPEVKRLYENAGWIWSPTRFATEPRPEPRRVAEAVEA